MHELAPDAIELAGATAGVDVQVEDEHEIGQLLGTVAAELWEAVGAAAQLWLFDCVSRCVAASVHAIVRYWNDMNEPVSRSCSCMKIWMWEAARNTVQLQKVQVESCHDRIWAWHITISSETTGRNDS